MANETKLSNGLKKLQFTRDAIRVAFMFLMFTAVIIVTVVGFAHSYAGLFDWGAAHKLTGWKRDSFPLLVDLFILIGELGLFLVALDGEKVRKDIASWMDIIIPGSVIVAGWGASLWFNVNHMDGATTDDKVTFAIPPIAAMVGLVILLRNVHRYTSRLAAPAGEQSGTVPTFHAERADVPEIPEPVPAPEPVAPADVPELEAAPEFVPDGLPAGAAVEPAAEPVAQRPVPAAEPVAPWTGNPAPVVVPEPVPAPSAAQSRNPKWELGIEFCMETYRVTGKLPSQRDVAAKLGQRNRQLPANIIAHVKNEMGITS